MITREDPETGEQITSVFSIGDCRYIGTSVSVNKISESVFEAVIHKYFEDDGSESEPTKRFVGSISDCEAFIRLEKDGHLRI